MEAIKGVQPTVTEALISTAERAEDFESILIIYRRPSADSSVVGAHGYIVGGCISRADINYLLDQTKSLLVRPCEGREL